MKTYGLSESGRKSLGRIPYSNTMSTRVMYVLRDQRSASVDDISSELRVPRSALEPAVKSLYSKGYIKLME